MHRITTFFIYAFLLDGLFSAVDALGRLHRPDASPSGLGILWSLSVLLLGIILFVGMVITPRLSKRLLLPPILFLAYAVVWSVMFGQQGELLLSFAEVMTALGVLFGFKRAEDEQEAISNFASKRPFFTWRNFFLTGCMNSAIALCVVLLIALSLTQKARFKIEDSTGRYMQIKQGGISLEERRFRKGDKEIRLIGMMHVAKSGFYDDVSGGLPSNANAVVLLEGVGDQEHLMKEKFGYSRVAGMLGISAQEDSTFTKKAVAKLKEAEAGEESEEASKNIEYQRADIDLSELKPDTLNFIQAIGTIIHSTDLQEALKKYSELEPVLERGSQTAFNDILYKRNDHLLGEISKALENHSTVVVPWGAAHMPGLQKKIQEWGFKETNRTQRQAVNFQSKALVGLIWLLDRLPGDEK